MPKTKAQMSATNKYDKNNYDRATILLSKGEKPKIQAHAALFKESLNAFIKRAIAETIERDKEKSGDN
ncbi:MAG: hypothetical protein LBS74_07955 [Oscillospiraceae bacterium]|nr:hypothetical protein [Oscillospiraceae bacterium]